MKAKAQHVDIQFAKDKAKNHFKVQPKYINLAKLPINLNKSAEQLVL